MATNFALASAGATASNSSSSGAGFPASAVINGLRHTNNAFGSGGAWATGTAQPQWVRIQFGQSRTINQIDVFTLADAVNYNTNPGSGDTFTSYGVSAATLKYWDGAAWQTITSYSSNNKVWKTLTFSDIATTEIEVYVTASPDGVSRLVEIEAWGPDVVDTTPDITTTTLPATTVGASYSQTIARTGGESPFVWDVTVGSLPPGLSLNSSTGVISGTPTTAGTYNFTVRVRDENAAAGCESDTQALSIVVNAAPVITTTSLPDGAVGSAYSQTIAKTGGTGSGTFAVQSGTLPAGLSLNTSTGAITGTPTTPGTSSFTIRYTDTVSVYDDQALTLFIDGTPTITTTTLPGGPVGVAYSQTIAAAGGNGTLDYTISAGSLPPGLSLNLSTGAITGTPTTEGIYSFTARVEDDDGDWDTQALSIAIGTPPVASFSVPERVGINQSFTPANNTPSATSYAWDKENDGTTDSTAFEPALSYASIGTKTIKLTATNAYGSHSVTHTIIVESMDVWNFCYFRNPLPVEYVQKLRVFEPREGADQTREDSPPKRQVSLDVRYLAWAEGTAVYDFCYAHRLRQPFLFKDERENEYFQAKIVQFPSESRRYGWGNFELIIREV